VSDGDPTAQLTFETLSADQFALDEPADAVEAINA
jgi:hypothetical protein